MADGKTALYSDIAHTVPASPAYFGEGFAARSVRLAPSENGTRASDAYSVVVHRGLPSRLEWREEGRTRERIFRPGDVSLHIPGELPPFRLADHADIFEMAVSPEYLGIVSHEVPCASLSHLYGVRDAQVEHIARALEADMNAGNPSGSLFVGGLFTALIAHLFALPAPINNTRVALSRKDLERVQEFVRAHLCEEITVVSLARLTYYSPHHFSCLFKTAMGISPHQFVLRERVRAAAALLAQADVPLSQVAYRVGFAHQSHLHRHFKGFMGCTPAQYRKSIL